ncbi:TRAP transporter substrate-binding protein DctP [Fertoebacter nigrum]|uniref:TRAP transporter substrate-binding protein DctP n=1 Tax=Fertoeibacter niger TaxID=2656921 RepID=A0A8X8KP30_9RHOB|nr:TRAP transporter substrate-binding protein DctP [Fertoeibacter niger]NUB45635.1 TRAP transporter substrate-binding protein DctP [Fertoeibacter niger]
MKTMFKPVTLALVLTLTGLAPGARAETYRMLSSWDTSTEPVAAFVAETFIPQFEAALPGHSVTAFGPESVPPFEQMEPVRAGVFQLLFTHTAYHYGTTRGAFAVDAIGGTVTERREAGIWDEVDRHYNTLGLKLIALVPVPLGFQIQTSAPLVDGQFTGMSIRGSQVYHGLISELGGAPVVMPIGEVYTALDRGVVQGAAGPLLGAVSLDWNSVATNLVRPRFGTPTYYLLMNMDTFEALPADQQDALLRVGADLELASEPHFQAAMEAEEAALIASGSTVVEIGGDKAAQIPQIWADTLFSAASETDAEVSNRLRELARAAGLTP